MPQQQVTAFPGPNLDETRRLQFADHLGPRHAPIVKPNARLCQRNRRPVAKVTGDPWHPNAGAPRVNAASANPTNYVDVSILADPTPTYKLWVRLRAENDYWGTIRSSFSSSAAP